MSIVISIKHKNVIYFGSHVHRTINGVIYEFRNENNLYFWPVPDTKKAIMAGYGLPRIHNVVRTLSLLPKQTKTLTFEDVANKVVTQMIEELKTFKYVDPEKTLSSGAIFLLAHKDNLYRIESNFSVITFEDYVVIGVGEEVALGSLAETVGLKPEERILRALRAMQRHNRSVDPPYVLMNTKDMQLKFIEK